MGAVAALLVGGCALEAQEPVDEEVPGETFAPGAPGAPHGEKPESPGSLHGARFQQDLVIVSGPEVEPETDPPDMRPTPDPWQPENGEERPNPDDPSVPADPNAEEDPEADPAE